MASDYLNILNELASIRTALERVDDSPIGIAATQLFRCTRLLFNSPVCRLALDEEAVQWRNANQTSIDNAISQAVAYDVFIIAHETTGWKNNGESVSNNRWGQNLKEILERWNRDLATTPARNTYFSLADERTLITILEILEKELGNLPQDEHLRTVLPKVKTLLNKIHKFKAHQEIASSLLSFLETTSRRTELQAFHEAATNVFAGTAPAMPWPEDHALASFLERSHRLPLLAGAIQLIDLVSLRIRQGAIPAHVISRLIIHLERFAKTDILAKYESKPNKAEAIVQSEVDRFIFGEGLYPITHAEASNGSIDTFIEDARPLFSDAEQPGHAAILIELKQALEGPSESEMKKVIRNARNQAQRYRDHLDGNPRWRGHSVIVLVVYGGDKHYLATDRDIKLVYLGNVTPSKGSTSLEIE